MMEVTDQVKVEKTQGILRILHNRPAKKHALTHAMYQKMVEAFRQADAEDDIKAVYLSGTSGCFTAGNDMEDFLQHPPEGPSAPVFQLLEAVLHCRKPVVAAASGAAVGIGTTILLHCDLVYCDDTARFRLPFVSLGLCPEAGSSLLLPLLAGYPRAAELLLLGEPFDAQQAYEMHLINRICAAQELQDYALGQAAKLTAQPAAAVRLAKHLMKESLLKVLPELMRKEGEQFVARLSSPEAIEAMSAFMEKRRPDFSRFG